MSCYEIEALRLGLMTVLGHEDEHARSHAEQELEGHLDGPIEGLATAETLTDIQRHLDAALVDLEETIASMDADDPEFNYTRGRLIAVRDAERSIHRLARQGTDIVDGLGASHDLLHETFPVE